MGDYNKVILLKIPLILIAIYLVRFFPSNKDIRKKGDQLRIVRENKEIFSWVIEKWQTKQLANG